MEVAFRVLFLPCPLDLNGTEFSCKVGEERRGCLDWELAGNLHTERPSSNMLSENFSSFFSAHNGTIVSLEAGRRQLDF